MVKSRRFFWKLFSGHVLLMALILCASVWVIVGEVERTSLQDLTDQLRARAATFRQQVADIFDQTHRAELQQFAAQLGAVKESNIRLTLIAVDGTVWADSQADPTKMVSHATRPEIIHAMAHGWGQAERMSETVHREMKYVALRMGPADHPSGIVRVAMPVPGIVARTETMRKLIWRITLLALIATILLALGLAYVWSNPIRRITETARSLSEGDLSARVEVTGRDEIAQLAESLNHMRDSLAAQLHTIDRQRRNLESLIRTLTEGIIVTDPDGRIAVMNPVACRLLQIQPPISLPNGETTTDLDDRHIEEMCVGRRVEECITHSQLLDLLLPKDRADRPDDGSRPKRDGPASHPPTPSAKYEIRLPAEPPSGEIHLLAHGSDIEITNADPLARSGSKGRLVVLSDVTELTQTIRMKTDFVANASHELRTPLSTIRASVETMMKMDLEKEKVSSLHFLEIIDRHTTRLEELVGDLLDLSRLEAASSKFVPEKLSLSDSLAELHARFARSLEEKNIHWKADCPRQYDEALISRHLLRLVLDNLISNAIQFTKPGGHISVLCDHREHALILTIRDDGCGIPAEEQDRVFERFYQVERARSDAAGGQSGKRGTGLGLSIVRHAVAAMNGTVRMQSRPGEGTTVFVTIPQQI